jgi:hypothetical protein
MWRRFGGQTHSRYVSCLVTSYRIVRCVGKWYSRCFRFRSLVPGYQIDGYIRAPGFVLYPYVFIAGPNKHDCSRRTRQRGNSDTCDGKQVVGRTNHNHKKGRQRYHYPNKGHVRLRSPDSDQHFQTSVIGGLPPALANTVAAYVISFITTGKEPLLIDQ